MDEGESRNEDGPMFQGRHCPYILDHHPQHGRSYPAVAVAAASACILSKSSLISTGDIHSVIAIWENNTHWGTQSDISIAGVLLILEMLTYEIDMLLNQGSMVQSLEQHSESNQEKNG